MPALAPLAYDPSAGATLRKGRMHLSSIESENPEDQGAKDECGHNERQRGELSAAHVLAPPATVVDTGRTF
jgi:hypothetical protein